MYDKIRKKVQQNCHTKNSCAKFDQFPRPNGSFIIIRKEALEAKVLKSKDLNHFLHFKNSNSEVKE